MNNLIVDYAMRFVGLPYFWGGNNPLTGMDCSGLAIEILKAFGFELSDMSAQEIYVWCLGQKHLKEIKPGSLVFFGRGGVIKHVGIAINHALMIEAGGGGPTITTQDEAARHSAFVRVRPIHFRKDFVEAYYPPYSVL
jgi:peptidoglycan DL-endopeptidase CwlO